MGPVHFFFFFFFEGGGGTQICYSSIGVGKGVPMPYLRSSDKIFRQANKKMPVYLILANFGRYSFLHFEICVFLCVNRVVFKAKYQIMPNGLK